MSHLGAQAVKVKDNVFPGLPTASIEPPYTEIHQNVRNEIQTDDLDKLAPRLWILATQDSSHVYPLHEQVMCGRRIVVTESARLHLVWFQDTIFIKPIPPYLLSYSFWLFFLCELPLISQASVSASGPPTTHSCDQQRRLYRTALGFVRTYSHLIRHESDFRLAIQSHLLPADISYTRFARFIQRFASVVDEEVSPRYLYGQLRLSRLNLWARPLLGKDVYYKIHRSYRSYFGYIAGPFVIGFALLSVLLSAFQVVLIISLDWKEGFWRWFPAVCLWMSVVTIVLALAVCVLFGALFLWRSLREYVFALSSLSQRRQTLAHG